MVIYQEAILEKSPASRVSNPIHHSRFQKLELVLNELFIKELNSKGSIFISIAPNVIKKMAMFLSGMSFRPAAIGVCGETASGKSTIVLDTINVIETFAQEFSISNAVTRINTDDYYYDRSDMVNKAGSFAEFAKNYDLDVPEAIELSLMKEHIQLLLKKEEAHLPKYDMSGTAIRIDNHTLVEPSSVIIAEGIYALADEISDIFDFKIYVDIDKSIQKNRFYERAQQRGLGESADRIYQNASLKAQIYVHPCKQNADIVLDGQASRERYRNFMSSLINILEATYFNFAL